MPKLILSGDIPADLAMFADTVGQLVDANNALADRVGALEKAPATAGAPSDQMQGQVNDIVKKYFSHEFEGPMSAPTAGRKITGYDPVTGAPQYEPVTPVQG